MTSGTRSIESIVYNKVSVKDFMQLGGFSKYPGVSVSKKGWIYVRDAGKTAPIMLMFDDDEVIVRGCYRRGKTETSAGFRLLTIMPKLLCDSANELFDTWCTNVHLSPDAYPNPKKVFGSVYVNYKESIEADFPISLKAFGVIPMFYAIPGESNGTNLCGISFRVSPSHVLEWNAVQPSGAGSDDDIVVVSASTYVQPEHIKKQIREAFANPKKSFTIRDDVEVKPEPKRRK